ncbi:uncharacterized protein LOC118437093 [Folsomia candida]|uniref:uncharacterized protein LOC118437093 n=1 Tax=Folsomia candida TaxID=158441 RepID=UPI001604B41A|nr:uncharacterized protein LOC118437093 [Folsomia candida]
MRVDSNSLALMATAGVILLISGHAAPKEVPYAGRCEPTDTCAGKDMTCRNGNCVCAKGYTGAYRCHEYTQIHRIITIEYHPWVIVNESCLSSRVKTASSCRHTTCYTGLLIDLLHKVDNEIKILNKCTIEGVEMFDDVSNTYRSFGKNDTVDVIVRGEADMALAAIDDRDDEWLAVSIHVKFWVSQIYPNLVGIYYGNDESWRRFISSSKVNVKLV